MTGQEIVTMCNNIIKRQDLNEDLLLQFINQERQAALRETYLYRIQEWRRNLEPEDGFLRTPRLKQARFVEWEPEPQDNVAYSIGKKKKLFPLNSMQEAYEIYHNVDVVGEPLHYIVLQGGLKIIPMPAKGVINIYGEWYPEDIQNDENEDALTKEISDIIVYNACAEYFDFLAEPEKANLWREKAQIRLDKYLKEIKRQVTDDTHLFARDPFGNLHIRHGRRKQLGHIYDGKELTGGTLGNVYTDIGD